MPTNECKALVIKVFKISNRRNLKITALVFGTDFL